MLNKKSLVNPVTRMKGDVPYGASPFFALWEVNKMRNNLTTRNNNEEMVVCNSEKQMLSLVLYSGDTYEKRKLELFLNLYDYENSIYLKKTEEIIRLIS